jgi:hypothetical protein
MVRDVAAVLKVEIRRAVTIVRPKDEIAGVVRVRETAAHSQQQVHSGADPRAEATIAFQRSLPTARSNGALQQESSVAAHTGVDEDVPVGFEERPQNVVNEVRRFVLHLRVHGRRGEQRHQRGDAPALLHDCVPTRVLDVAL